MVFCIVKEGKITSPLKWADSNFNQTRPVTVWCVETLAGLLFWPNMIYTGKFDHTYWGIKMIIVCASFSHQD